MTPTPSTNDQDFDGFHDEMRRGHPRVSGVGGSAALLSDWMRRKHEYMGMQTTLTAKLKLVTTPEQFPEIVTAQVPKVLNAISRRTDA
jgi:hypothetical protein